MRYYYELIIAVMAGFAFGAVVAFTVMAIKG